jgi:hypothetical protein
VHDTRLSAHTLAQKTRISNDAAAARPVIVARDEDMAAV